jgi:hypothetical protein
MSETADAELIVLVSRKPLAPPFHRHIARSRLMNQSCRVGDRVIMYEIVQTRPDGLVRATDRTHFEFR